ncbi:MAG: hypothetical protein CME25_08680 [Gemmatimonadetes bacterium]|nr:hypothetical protein [Gemmatimonadota bacterium]
MLDNLEFPPKGSRPKELKIQVRSALILLSTFGILVINFDWGLPNKRRLELIGGKDVLASKISQILRSKERVNQIPTPHLQYDEQIHLAVREFLLSPWAGDDNLTLAAIKRLNPYNLEFDPGYYIYGGGLIYSGAVFLQVAAWFGFVTLNPDAVFYMNNPDELGRLYTVLRLMIVISATVGIFLLNRLTAQFYGEKVALVAWGITLFTPLTYEPVHSVEPHIFVLVFFLLSFYFTLRAVKGESRKNFFLAAVFAGVSIGTQALSFYIVFAFFAALVINCKNGTINLREASAIFMRYVIISVGCMLLLNPFYILNFTGFLGDLSFGTGQHFFRAPKTWAPYNLSWFLLIALLAAVIYHLVKFRQNAYSAISVACIIPAIFVYVLLGNYHMTYVYSSIPLMGVLLAVMLRDIYVSLKDRSRAAFVVLVVVLFLVFPGARSVYYLINFSSVQREEAGEWINANVPVGSTIAVMFPPSIWDCVPFEFYNYRLVEYRAMTLFDEPSLADAVVLLNAPLPDNLKDHYKLVKAYYPNSVFGFRFELAGEIHALIGKSIEIYVTANPNSVENVDVVL